jgi:hypothetical protein
MVRQSKLPEITLHLDNKKETLSEIALSSNGSINIFPTSQGGIFPVKNLISGLDLIDFMYYDKNVLYLGNDIELSTEDLLENTDLSGGEVEEIHINCNEKLFIGEDIQIINNEGEEEGGSNMEIRIVGDTISIDGSGGETSIIGDIVNIEGEHVKIIGKETILIGKDSSGEVISENIKLYAKDTIDIESIDISGNIYIESNNILISGVVKYENEWNLEGEVTFLDEIKVPRGLRYDEGGKNTMYVSEEEELGGTLNFKIDVSGGGFVYESSIGEEILRILPSGVMTVQKNLNCEEDMNIEKDIHVNGNIITDNVEIDTSGNIWCKNSIYVDDYIQQINDDTNEISFKVDTSGNMIVNKIDVSGNIESFGDLSISGILEAKQVILRDINGGIEVDIDGSGNISCTGTIESENNRCELVHVSDDENNINTGTIIREDSITTDQIICRDAILTELNVNGIHIYENNIECSGSLVVHSDVEISGDCISDNVRIENSFTCPKEGDKQVIIDASGNFISTGEVIFDVLHTKTIDMLDGIIFDTSGGIITGKSLNIENHIHTKSFENDVVRIDGSGIYCDGVIFGEIFEVLDASGSTRIKLDSSGSITANGILTMNGNITTDGELNVLNNLEVNGEIECDRYESKNGNISIGNNLHPVDGGLNQSIILTSQDTNNTSCGMTYIREENMEIIKYNEENLEMNEIKSNSIKIGKYTNTIMNENPVKGEEISSIEIGFAEGSIIIKKGIETTELTSDSIKTGIVNVDRLITNDIYMGETIYVEDTGVFKRENIEITIPSGESELFGPEYTLVLNIYHTTLGNIQHQINLYFIVNLGTFFNDITNICEGYIGDDNLNGSDRVIFKKYDEGVWGNKVNEIYYRRTGNILNIELNDIGGDLDTSYKYYICKGYGLGLSV